MEPTRKTMEPPPLIPTKLGARGQHAAPPGSSAVAAADPEGGHNTTEVDLREQQQETERSSRAADQRRVGCPRVNESRREGDAAALHLRERSRAGPGGMRGHGSVHPCL